jgi:hypothetical protein
MRRSILTTAAVAVALAGFTLAAAARARPVTRVGELEALAERLEAELIAARPDAYERLKAVTWGPQGRLNAAPNAELMFLRERGLPVFYATDNINAARTVSTDDVWPGGSGGFSLTGSGTVLGELAIWDGGGVLTTHQEFAGRAVQQDAASGTSYHATHVAGTMIGAGVRANAIGMSYEATLAAYDWDGDASEMATAAAAGLNISNHSYGYVTGWYFDQDWYWFGDVSVSAVEDYGFGYYGWTAREFDQMAYDAPYYTIVKSAGNDRDDTGPAPGEGHWFWDVDDWAWSTDTRDPDGGLFGLDTIGWYGNAKNVISVGAAGDIPDGYEDPSDVVLAAFSSWGPTDDGRIKPDLVANGVGLYSATDAGTTRYATYSGTSMSTPNVSGSLNLLVRHFEATHGLTPLASTMKAVLVQTADEAGAAPGPDYFNGWGLMNTLHAAELIETDGGVPGHIWEAPLANGETDSYVLYCDGTGPLRVTLAWTDPPGTPVDPPELNPTDLMIVNDLDILVEHTATETVYRPYLLNPFNPAVPATTGDNVRDVTEQVHIESPAAGEYRVTVSHKGSLSSPQTYSLASTHNMTAGETGIDEPLTGERAFALLGNHPNPFNPSTTVSYMLRRPARVVIAVHDLSGRVVRVLEDGVRGAGNQRAEWDGRDGEGREVASGVYFCRLEVGGESQESPMVLLK